MEDNQTPEEDQNPKKESLLDVNPPEEPKELARRKRPHESSDTHSPSTSPQRSTKQPKLAENFSPYDGDNSQKIAEAVSSTLPKIPQGIISEIVAYVNGEDILSLLATGDKRLIASIEKTTYANLKFAQTL
jgi:hypothetical protein